MATTSFHEPANPERNKLSKRGAVLGRCTCWRQAKLRQQFPSLVCVSLHERVDGNAYHVSWFAVFFVIELKYTADYPDCDRGLVGPVAQQG